MWGLDVSKLITRHRRQIHDMLVAEQRTQRRKRPGNRGWVSLLGTRGVVCARYVGELGASPLEVWMYRTRIIVWNGDTMTLNTDGHRERSTLHVLRAFVHPSGWHLDSVRPGPWDHPRWTMTQCAGYSGYSATEFYDGMCIAAATPPQLLSEVRPLRRTEPVPEEVAKLSAVRRRLSRLHQPHRLLSTLPGWDSRRMEDRFTLLPRTQWAEGATNFLIPRFHRVLHEGWPFEGVFDGSYEEYLCIIGMDASWESALRRVSRSFMLRHREVYLREVECEGGSQA